MSVICSLPIQIPVHRVRITVRCLQTGGPVHTAVLRLADYYGPSAEEIAEPLGLAIPTVERLLTDLSQGGELIEREFVMWVDHARAQVLPYEALTGVAVLPHPGGGIELSEDWPTPNMLENMGLSAGLSWDVGLEGNVEVHKILDVTPDIRTGLLPHRLRLPDTHLVVSKGPDPSEPHQLTITQHGEDDPLLTHWVREHFRDYLEERLKQGKLTEHTFPEKIAKVTGKDGWEPLEPHPGVLREQITQAIEGATQRVALLAPSLAFIPTWIEQLLQDAEDRGVPVLLCPAKDDQAPRGQRFQFTGKTLAGLPALTLIADEDHAVIHSDPQAALDRRAGPTPQHLYTTHEKTAIGGLLDKLGLGRLTRTRPRHKLTPQQVTSLLTTELQNLSGELPEGVRAAIQPADQQAAAAALDRYTTPDRDATKAMRSVVAGFAWERVVIERVAALAAQHTELTITGERWKPPGVSLDLDVIVHDQNKNVVWILDAKNTSKDNRQLDSMKHQIRLLKHAPELTHDCHTIIGLIVHRADQLPTHAEPTEHPSIHHCTLQALGDLLLANRLPGQRPKVNERGRKAA